MSVKTGREVLVVSLLLSKNARTKVVEAASGLSLQTT